MNASNLATYNLQIFSPEPEGDTPSLTSDDKRVLADMPARIEALEEVLEAALPEGYRVRITEWDK